MTITGFASISTPVSTLISATETHLYGAQRTQLNKLNGAIGSPAAGTFVFEFAPAGLVAGSYVEIDDEVMYVWSVDTGTKTATVERGQLGSTAATHADDAVIRVTPRFTRVQILNALRDEIRSWPPQIYAVVRGILTAVADTRAIDLAGTSAMSGLRFLRASVERTVSTPSGTKWHLLEGAHIESHADTTDFPSGKTLRWATYLPEAANLNVVLGAEFATGSFTSTIGLTSHMLDIPPIGAAVRLLFPKEIKRTDDAAQGRSRLAEDVPPGAASRTAQEMLGWRDRRLSEEINRLVSDFGWHER